MTRYEDRWDSLIQYWVYKIWPDLSWKLIKCQIRKESSFDPSAVSSCGAVGLMQLMPAKARDLGIAKEELFNPEKNLEAGIKYFKI